ncbi:MAG TPA: TVP38/TMEM64 family protein [Dongiaceae bacterium]
MAGSVSKASKKGGIRRWLPLLAILLAAAAFFAFGLQHYLTLEALRANGNWLYGQVNDHLALALVIYVLVYAGVVMLSLPGATILTLAGGCLFGLWLATGVTILAATLGATLLYLAARTAFADLLRARAAPWLKRLSAGFQDNAFSYLLFLRLVPAFPFFVVNLVPAFLGVGLRIFVLATFIGIIPGTFVYAGVGAGLKSLLDSNQPLSLGSVLTPQIVIALIGLALLSLLPVAWKAWRKSRGGSSK